MRLSNSYLRLLLHFEATKICLAEFSRGFISTTSIIFTLCHTSPVLAQSPPVSPQLLSDGFLADLTVSQPISTPLTSLY